MDVSTYDCKIIRGGLNVTSREADGRSRTACRYVSAISDFTRLVAGVGVLVKIVGGQQDGMPFVVVRPTQNSLNSP